MRSLFGVDLASVTLPSNEEALLFESSCNGTLTRKFTEVCRSVLVNDDDWESLQCKQEYSAIQYNRSFWKWLLSSGPAEDQTQEQNKHWTQPDSFPVKHHIWFWSSYEQQETSPAFLLMSLQFVFRHLSICCVFRIFFNNPQRYEGLQIRDLI